MHAAGELSVKADRLDSKVDDLGRKLAQTATKKELTDLQHTMLHYARHVEGMLERFAESQVSLEERVTGIQAVIDDLKRRIDELERRNPPQAA